MPALLFAPSPVAPCLSGDGFFAREELGVFAGEQAEETTESVGFVGENAGDVFPLDDAFVFWSFFVDRIG
jgi:hypothetical protein